MSQHEYRSGCAPHRRGPRYGALFVARFLASLDADFICGQTLNVDGGRNML
jgi:hypothetical protein